MVPTGSSARNPEIARIDEAIYAWDVEHLDGSKHRKGKMLLEGLDSLLDGVAVAPVSDETGADVRRRPGRSG